MVGYLLLDQALLPLPSRTRVMRELRQAEAESKVEGERERERGAYLQWS